MSASADSSPITGDALAARAAVIRAEVGSTFIGQSAVLEQILTALLAGGHVLIEGVPGLGKTLLVRALAAVIGASHARVQFTPDLMPADVCGHVVWDARSEEFIIRRGPVFTHLLLADEINRAPAKTQSALLEAMQERQVTIEGHSTPLPAPFMVLATQNPVEHEGTYPLPEAQLDRFLLKILIDYPAHADEVAMVTAIAGGKLAADFDLASLRQVVQPGELAAMQQSTAAVRVDATVIDYAVRIAVATRQWPGLALGAGPRGSLALIRAARAQALLDGRDFATPDDVQRIALPALRHHIVLTPEWQMEGRSPDQALAALLADVAAPRQ